MPADQGYRAGNNRGQEQYEKCQQIRGTELATTGDRSNMRNASRSGLATTGDRSNMKNASRSGVQSWQQQGAGAI
jgi:hypothetical protein